MICFVCELSTLEHVAFTSAASFIAESLTSIGIGIYFMRFKDCAVFYLWITCLLALFSLAFALLSQETPHFLFKCKRFEECHQHLTTMAWFNGYPSD
jgi:hypothetical protein